MIIFKTYNTIQEINKAKKNFFFPFVFLSVDSLVNRFISVLLSVHALLVCWVWLALEWKWPSAYLHSCCVANWHTAKLIQCTEAGGSQEQTLYWCFSKYTIFTSSCWTSFHLIQCFHQMWRQALSKRKVSAWVRQCLDKRVVTGKRTPKDC